jgi:acyl-CoA synthetase (AMP-forming)/AMP-acid ligase II
MNIARILQEQSARRPGQVAIVDPAERLTFEELDRAGAAAAADLSAAGLRPGDRALVFCPMSARLYVTLIGMFRLGVAAVFVDPSAGRGHIERCCARARPRAFVATPRAHALRLVSPAIRRLPLKLAIGEWVPGTRTVARRRADPDVRADIEPCGIGDTALLTFTSGSTGEPKAAVRTHGFLRAQHQVLADELRMTAGEVDLATLPIFVLANLASGLTSVIPDVDLRRPGAIDASRLARQIRTERPTRAAASPALFDRLASHLRSRGERLDGITRIYTGGAPVFPHLLRSLAAIAPASVVSAVYGSTEAEPIAHLDRAEIGARDLEAMSRGAGLLAGRPVSAIDVRVLPDRWGTSLGPYPTDAAFAAESVPTGSAGEIVVAGPHVLPGYLDGAGDEETKIRVGDRVWHRTGDAGYFDGDGRLWLLGRCSARLTDRYGTLYPFAVEAAASDVAGVRRSAFVMHRDTRTLVVEPAADGEPIPRSSLLERFEWAHLDDIVVVDAIPVDTRHNGKVDYPALEALLKR